jgi:hypothetical protein
MFSLDRTGKTIVTVLVVALIAAYCILGTGCSPKFGCPKTHGIIGVH